MSLAFDKQGKPFAWHRRTTQLLVRLFRNPSARGTCAQVLDDQGEPRYVDADTDYLTFRKVIGHVPGLYRLDQCDDDGTEIDDAPPAYVSVDMSRNASNAGTSFGEAGEVNPLVIIEHLVAIQADVMKTMATQQASILAASAEVLRARPALSSLSIPAEPARATEDERSKVDDEEEDDDADEVELEPDPWAAWRPLLEMAEPHLPTIGAFLYEKITALVKTSAATTTTTTPRAAVPASMSVTAPAAATAAPSSGQEPTRAAAGPSAPAASSPAESTVAATVRAPSAVMSATDAMKPEDAVVTVADASDERTEPVSTDASSDPTIAPTIAASPSAPASAVSEDVTDAVTNTSVPIAPVIGESSPAVALVTTRSDVAAGAAPRNAAAPTPAQWRHLYAIREQLTPSERANAELLITQLSPSVIAQLLVELSALSVDDAASALRTTMRRLAVMKQ